MELKPGDVVVTGSNPNQRMDLEEVKDGVAKCSWLGKDGEKKEGHFPLHILRRPIVDMPSAVNPRY